MDDLRKQAERLGTDIRYGMITKVELSKDGSAPHKVTTDDGTVLEVYSPEVTLAVEEYAETKARFDELSAQREDLEQAEKDLRDLIGRLVEQMRATFVENFKLLQGYFSETFRRLFGGGQAQLILTDPEDPLNCAIEINAQPPGKKLQLLQKLEAPCSDETELLEAAIQAGPKKVVIKRPLKGPYLADRKPAYSIRGKAVRYDCIVPPQKA